MCETRRYQTGLGESIPGSRWGDNTASRVLLRKVRWPRYFIVNQKARTGAWHEGSFPAQRLPPSNHTREGNHDPQREGLSNLVALKSDFLDCCGYGAVKVCASPRVGKEQARKEQSDTGRAVAWLPLRPGCLHRYKPDDATSRGGRRRPGVAGT